MDFITEGFVIKEAISGESDKFITILTSSSGRITAFGRGTKHLTNHNSAACQPLVYGEFEISQKKGLNIIKSATVKNSFYPLVGNLEGYYLACYFADVLSRVTTENSENTEDFETREVLRLVLNCVYAICYKKHIPLSKIKAAFELRLMSIIGYMPDLSCCGECGCPTQLHEANKFSFESATLICRDCMNKRATNLGYCCSVNADTVLAMAHIIACEQEKLLSFSVDDDTLGELCFVCENYLLYKTETSYETLKIYKSANLLPTKQQENNV